MSAPGASENWHIDINEIKQLLDNLHNNQPIVRRVDLQTGQVTLEAADAEQDFEYSDHYVRKVMGPRWNMLLIGAGHLSHYVSHMALTNSRLIGVSRQNQRCTAARSHSTSSHW